VEIESDAKKSAKKCLKKKQKRRFTVNTSEYAFSVWLERAVEGQPELCVKERL